MIQAIHVSKRYGPKTAVDNVTVDIKKNRITSLIGPNGAGKSTLSGPDEQARADGRR